MALRKKSPSPQDETVVPLHPNAAPEAPTPQEKIVAALRASGVDVDALPPPSGKYNLAIRPNTIVAEVTSDVRRLSFEATVQDGPYAGRRVPIRLMTRHKDLEKYDLAVRQGVTALSAWTNAVGLDPDRDMPPYDPDDPEKALRAIGIGLWTKGRALKIEVDVEVSPKGFINIRNVRRVA